jgi:hypothetical protein
MESSGKVSIVFGNANADAAHGLAHCLLFSMAFVNLPLVDLGFGRGCENWDGKILACGQGNAVVRTGGFLE